MQDDDVIRQRDALALKLQRALRDAGIDSAADTAAVLHKKNISISRATIDRYWSNRLPTDNKLVSRNAMEAIAGLTEHPADIMRDWEELLSRARDVRYGKSSEAASNDEPESAQRSAKWLQVIPLQGTRLYHSVDLVEFTEMGNSIEGTFRRLSPEAEEGYLWKIRGYAQGDDAYYYAFYAHHESAAVSVGAMSLMVADFRPRSYKGQYSRRDLPPGGGWELAHRRVEWYKKLPTRYLNRVALLDLDNTLRKGWTISRLQIASHFRILKA